MRLVTQLWNITDKQVVTQMQKYLLLRIKLPFFAFNLRVFKCILYWLLMDVKITINSVA